MITWRSLLVGVAIGCLASDVCAQTDDSGRLAILIRGGAIADKISFNLASDLTAAGLPTITKRDFLQAASSVGVRGAQIRTREGVRQVIRDAQLAGALLGRLVRTRAGPALQLRITDGNGRAPEQLMMPLRDMRRGGREEIVALVQAYFTTHQDAGSGPSGSQSFASEQNVAVAGGGAAPESEEARPDEELDESDEAAAGSVEAVIPDSSTSTALDVMSAELYFGASKRNYRFQQGAASSRYKPLRFHAEVAAAMGIFPFVDAASFLHGVGAVAYLARGFAASRFKEISEAKAGDADPTPIYRYFLDLRYRKELWAPSSFAPTVKFGLGWGGTSFQGRSASNDLASRTVTHRGWRLYAGVRQPVLAPIVHVEFSLAWLPSLKSSIANKGGTGEVASSQGYQLIGALAGRGLPWAPKLEWALGFDTQVAKVNYAKKKAEQHPASSEEVYFTWTARLRYGF